MHLQADGGDMSIDLHLNTTKPPTLQGDRGFSPKGTGAGNASYYYSLTRMDTTGTVRVKGTSSQITGGTSWMDHEWGTSRLESGSIGWDWFALQLSDGREITWAQVRGRDNHATPASFGTLTAANGQTTRLSPADVTLEPLSTWTSPRSGAHYPARWRLRVASVGLDLQVTPRMPDQELPV